MPLVVIRDVDVSTVQGVHSYVSRPSVTGHILAGGERLSNRGVQAEWEQAFKTDTWVVIRAQVARAEAVSAADESYALCAVPFGRSLALAVREGSKGGRRTIAQLSETNPGVVVNLTAAETQAASQHPASASTSASATSDRTSALTPATSDARELSTPFPTTFRSALYVTDMNGWPVPYAVVGTTGAGTLVGDAAGVIALPGTARSAGDSTGAMTATIYRIGYDGDSGQIAPQRGSQTFRLS